MTTFSRVFGSRRNQPRPRTWKSISCPASDTGPSNQRTNIPYFEWTIGTTSLTQSLNPDDAVLAVIGAEAACD